MRSPWRLALVGLAVAAGLAAVSYWAGESAGRARPGATTERLAERARVERVVDGDSLRLAGGENLRLVGIDCPERDEPFHDEATRLAREMLEGKDVALEYDKEHRDRYGRLLAHVWLGGEPGAGVLASERLLDAGLAWCFEVPPNLRYAARLRAAQDAARKAKRGVWAAAAATSEDGGEVIASASESARRFHRPDCPAVRSIKTPVRHSSRDAALDAGLSPCRQCKP